MRRSNAITLKDVAREAGVAKMTASVVLNGARSGTQVSETTRARIIEVAARLGYRPNAVARGLSRRRMDVIVQGTGLNYYFLEVFNGVLEVAVPNRQSATVFGIPGWAGEQIQAELLNLCDGRVDGLIFIGPHLLDRAFIESVQQHTPLVAVHAEDPPPSLYNVDIDNAGGIYAATRLLIELGHQRIAHLAGNTSLPFIQAGARNRIEGYRRALEDAGIPFDPTLVLPGYYIEPSGRERMERLLDSPEPLPTALCCANDSIALGCLGVCQERGIRVPEDISITGFDNVLTTRLTAPPLTTVGQPLIEMGRRAAQLLLEQIQDTDGESELEDTASRTIVFPVELIVRGSVGPPPVLPVSRS
jgi:DNA-binding LacI/PurR family transcriptional regulator